VHLSTHSDQLMTDNKGRLTRPWHASHALMRIHNGDALTQVGIVGTARARERVSRGEGINDKCCKEIKGRDGGARTCQVNVPTSHIARGWLVDSSCTRTLIESVIYLDEAGQRSQVVGTWWLYIQSNTVIVQSAAKNLGSCRAREE